jgi:hypothetical protein
LVEFVALSGFHKGARVAPGENGTRLEPLFRHSNKKRRNPPVLARQHIAKISVILTHLQPLPLLVVGKRIAVRKSTGVQKEAIGKRLLATIFITR